jgi:sensor histidine kinase regulating citrate/malate metabolism
VSDVVTILGNLLDNAFDAVAKVEDKMIKLDVESSKGSLYIKIDNTFDGEVKYADGADNAEELDRVIVSRKTASGHGYGLSNIRKSVEKYDGHMDVSHEGNIFSVGILLYV